MEQRFAFRLKWRRIGLAIGFAALLLCGVCAALYLSSDEGSQDDVLEVGGVLLLGFTLAIAFMGLRLRRALKTLGAVIVNERGIRWESNGAVAWEGSWDKLEVASVDREGRVLWIRRLPDGELFALNGVDAVEFADFDGLVDAIGHHTSVTGNLSKIVPVNSGPEVSDEALKAVVRLGLAVLALVLALSVANLVVLPDLTPAGARRFFWVFPPLALFNGRGPLWLMWKAKQGQTPPHSGLYDGGVRRRVWRNLLLVVLLYGLYVFMMGPA